MMNKQREGYYRLAPGLDVLQLPDGNILFRSDTLAIRIEGEFAKILVEQVLPLLDGTRSLDKVAVRLPYIPEDDLRIRLDSLVQAHVLLYADRPQEQRPIAEQVVEPFLSMLDTLGVSSTEALEKLSQLRIGIVGLEGYGAYVASLLARCGIGSIVLVDPYLCQPGNLLLMPMAGLDAIGVPREDALKAALQARGGKTEVLTSGGAEITRESIAALASSCHMVVGAFDRGFSSTNHWINRMSVEHGVPAIYAESRSHTMLVGPLVMPSQTACYMCYRMRSIACEEDFNAAMSYEEFLDQQKRPALHERSVLPATSPYMGSLVTMEILKYFLSLSKLSLAGKVLEFDGLSFYMQTHTILQKPDCPVCNVKKKWIRHNPTLGELLQSKDPPGNLLEVASQLLSRRTGIIRNFGQVEKDVGEPVQPYIFRVEIGNHSFLDRETKDYRMCSGKGMTISDAHVSALGEGVERYSGDCWDYSEIVYGRGYDFDGDVFDPRQLVLYTPGQYEHLPYVPYNGENYMGWVSARSIVTGKQILVPAIAVYMSYEVRLPTEFICPITSNGLAAGRTLLDAILAAAFEVLERDAFIIMWLNRLPCQRFDPWGHPDADMIQLCNSYRRRGVEMHLYRLPTDHHCHVFAALGVQTNASGGPAIVVGLGADTEPIKAARKALLEVGQVHPGLRRRMRNKENRQRMEELADDPRLVTSLEDHDLLYAHPRMIGAFDFLFERPLVPFDWQTPMPQHSTDKLQLLVDQWQAEGWDLIYYNLTPPDMRSLGLHTVRAIIPGFQPIHFGWKEPRLGGERLYELPHRLGLRPARTTPEQLNTDPHPLA